MDETGENNTTQIRCEDELTLQKLLDEELDADASELVFHHLKGCHRCSAVFQELKELKSLCHGQLGLEDESEAVYSAAALNRVRGAIETATVAQTLRPGAQSEPVPSGNGHRQPADSDDIPEIGFPPNGAPKQNWFWFGLDRSFWLRPGVITTVVAVLPVIVGLTFWLRHLTPVSAAELLRQSAAADDAIASHADQVLRRTINLEQRNVRQTSSLSNAMEPNANDAATHRRIEVWQSADRALVARRLFDDKNHLVAGEWKKTDGSRVVYQEGTQAQLQPAAERQPSALLTPDRIWQLDVSAKDFSALVGNVTTARVEQTDGTYVINYDAPATASYPGVLKATLVLSKADLHTIEQTLLINSVSENGQSAIGNRQWTEFRFIETSFERHTPSTVAPAVFEPDPVVLASAKNKDERLKMKAESDDSAHPSSLIPHPSVAASSELEVDVLERLNRVNAFLGEQLSLTRTAEGTLLVSGIVETSERKSEILHSLGDITKNPAIKIEVSTVAEAQRRQKPGNSGSISVQDVGVAQNTIPVDAELRPYLSRSRGLAGQPLEQEIEQLPRRVLGHSARARSHALALKQIAERFSPADLEAMDSAARTRWRALIKEHANFFRHELDQVRQEIGPIFPGSAVESSSNIEIATDQDIARAAKRLFEMAAVTDNGLRRSFSLSTEQSDAPVRSQQFWRSLREAESLALRISDFR